MKSKKVTPKKKNVRKAVKKAGPKITYAELSQIRDIDRELTELNELLHLIGSDRHCRMHITEPVAKMLDKQQVRYENSRRKLIRAIIDIKRNEYNKLVDVNPKQ